jgi:dUTPase
MVPAKLPEVEFVEIGRKEFEEDKTERGAGGFGSTGE